MNSRVLECGCCFDTIVLNDVVTCANDHVICAPCLERGVANAIGDNKEIKCAVVEGCNAEYTHKAIVRAIEDHKLRMAYNNVLANIRVRKSGVSGMHCCPFCDNAVIIDADVLRFRNFKCNQCQRISCRVCHQAGHTGVCNSERRKEEEATLRYIITCDCGNKFIRGDACNKLACPACRRKFCWICKARLGVDGYLHFAVKGDKKDKRCQLYGERPENQVVVERTRKEYSRVRVNYEEPTMQTVSIDTSCNDCSGFDDTEPIVPCVTPVAMVVGRRRRRLLPTCGGIVKRSGQACKYKGAFDGYCKHHISNDRVRVATH